MTLREYHAIPDISWNLRSILAATGVAVCIFLTAFSATASTRQIEAARAAERQLADEARLVEALADYLAAETEMLRADLGAGAPRLKPAPTTGDVLTARAPAAGLAAFDLGLVHGAKTDAAEHRCLAQAIYYEARSESRIGQVAVADVVLNRVASSVYPNTICGVVFQGSERRTGCQFSFTCDGSMNRRLNAKLWRQSEMLAGAVLSGMRLPVSRQATHYHANYVSPVWARKLTPTAVIGKHKFYRFPNRRATAAAPAAM